MAKRKTSTRQRPVFSGPPTREKMALMARWLDDKQARDVQALDVTGLCSIAEGMVLATARNARHAQALGGHLLDMAGEQGWEYLGMEGQRTGNWLLIDFNDVVAHVFLADTRIFYNLEGLWSEAERVELDLPGAKAEWGAPDDSDADGEED